MLDPESRMKLTAFSLLVLLSAGSPAALGAAGQAVPNAFVPSQLPVDLLPVPKQVLWGSGEFSITPSTRIVVGNSATDEDLFAARELNEELRARYGVELDVVRVVTIRDKPDHAIRAVHVLLDASSGEFHSKLIDRILALYKFNTLIVEAEDVQWESGRALWSPDSRWATKAQVQELLEVARQHHVQVIPLISTLGHSEWVFAGLRDEALCAEVADIPKQLREQGRPQVTCDRTRGVYPAVYDPDRTITVNGTATTLNEALIFPVLKEAIGLFRPAYLHLGHDEVRGPSGLRYDMELYLRDIVTLSRFLRSAGGRPMVWGDVLWERRAGGRAAAR